MHRRIPSAIGWKVQAPELRVRAPSDFKPISPGILETTIIPEFEAVAARQPEKAAIKRGEQMLTYRQLNNAANHLAGRIIRELSTDRSPVAILLDDEVACVVAALGVVKSGSPYVMLYPGSSNEPGKFAKDSGARLLVTSSALQASLGQAAANGHPPRTLLLDELSTEEQVPNPPVRLGPEDLFAIYYTSGSTGQPKGVVEGHLVRSWRAYANINALRMAPSDRTGLVLSVWHAGALSNLMSVLVSGATLYPLNLRSGNPPDAARWIKDERITGIWCTPTVLRAMLGDAPSDLTLPDLRFMRLGGETISAADIALFKAHTADDCLLNVVYATSEASAVCEHAVYHDTPPFAGLIPAGEPLPGVEVLILDEQGQEVPSGALGEICVASPYLSLGYWKNPALTEQVFVPHPPDPDRRLCHTGDVGRWRDDGLLDIVGRRDTQVKIRGFRVQLEAVDLALRGLEGIAEAATVVDRPAGRGARLVAYLVMQPGQTLHASHVRRELSTRLPAFSIPALFMQVESLPRTGLGKVARIELPPPSLRRPDLDVAFRAPKSESERSIVAIWEKVLELHGIGLDDSFFDLGGDSLAAVEMSLEVERSLGGAVPQSFFKRPTVASLVDLLDFTRSNTAQEASAFLSSHRIPEAPQEGLKRRKRVRITPRKLLTRSYSGRDLDRLIDLLVLRRMAAQDYSSGMLWARRWSQNPLVQSLLYGRRRMLFRNWIDCLPSVAGDSSELFGMNILANLMPRRRVGGDVARGAKAGGRTREFMRHRFWRDLASRLDATMPGELPEFMELRGREHLMESHGRGHGVILVSMHGLPGPAHLLAIEKYLRLERITTISYRTPRRQSRYWDGADEIPDQVADAMNTEVALHAARQLQGGRVIQLLSETPDRQGRTYSASIARRMYQLKAGFAELALNTGAAIVPHWRYLLPDGRLRLEFGPPLTTSHADRGGQVENLVQQYAQFMEATWRAHPESVRWGKMLKHLRRPLGSSPG